VEQIQVIQEKEMTSKLLKHFSIRILIYCFLYFATVVGLFIFQPFIKSTFWMLLLVTAINVLFLMILSRSATTDAFNGINTTSAPRKSLKRIANVTSVPLFICTAVFSFIDIIFLHSVFDTSNGYTKDNIPMFAGVVAVNLIIWTLVVNVYERRIIRKYVSIEEEAVTE